MVRPSSAINVLVIDEHSTAVLDNDWIMQNGRHSLDQVGTTIWSSLGSWEFIFSLQNRY